MNKRLNLTILLIPPLVLLLLNTSTVLMRFNRISRDFIFTALLSIVFVRLVNGKKSIYMSRLKAFWIIGICCLWITCLYSVNRSASINFCISTTVYFSIFLLSLNKNFYRRLIDVLHICLAVWAFSVLLNVFIPNLMTRHLSFLTLPAVKPTLYTEVASKIYSGLFADHHTAAYAMNLGFAISFSKWLNGSKKINIYGMVLFIAALFFTGKRTLMIIPVLMVLAQQCVGSKSKRKTKITVFMIVFGLCALVLVNVFPNLLGRFSRSGDTLATRTDLLWPVAISMFKSHVMMGTGINTYNTVMQRSYSVGGTLFSEWSHQAHNIYVQILGETGLIGSAVIFTCFIYAIVKTIKLIRKGRRRDKSLLTLSLMLQVLFLVYGLTGNTFYYGSQQLCYFIAIGMLEVRDDVW